MTTTIKHQLTIPKEYAGIRLDQTLASLLPQYSRSRLKNWIQLGHITVNGKTKCPKDKMTGEEIITIDTILEEEINIQPEKIELSIIYEDDDIIVIDKPAGMIVHPGAGNREHTLLNALLYHSPKTAELPRGGIIHRLDKNTSGLLIIAKTLPAYTRLVRALQRRKIEREYEAIVIGTLTGGGTIEAPVGRHPKLRTHMAVIASGKPAITHYRIIERFKYHTHLQIKLETGRTHQIRVHMAYIRHPLIGDQTYGGKIHTPKNTNDKLIESLKQFKRQALHATRLRLTHPITKTQMIFESKRPQDMHNLLEVLRKEKE